MGANHSQKLIIVVRWLGVLPAAVLADVAVQTALVAVVRIAGLGPAATGGMSIARLLMALLHHGPRKAAYVFAGAKMAPRRQGATSIVLAALSVCLSLATHIVLQLLAGNRLGPTNYLDFGFECAGAIAAAAGILLQERRKQRTVAVRA